MARSTCSSLATPSAVMNEQCSMLSTPAAAASVMPCGPWACAATGSPRRCASVTTVLSSVRVYCDSCGCDPGVSWPPVAMILTTSVPRSARSATAERSASMPGASPPRNQQWPCTVVIGGPATRTCGPAAGWAASSARKASVP